MKMTTLSRGEYDGLRAILPRATKDGLRDTLGISETTWKKLRLGEPIRQSTYERLFERYRQLSGVSA